LSANVFHTLYGFQLLHYLLQSSSVVDHYRQSAKEDTIVGVDADTSQLYFLFFADDAGYVVHYTNIVIADYFQRDGVLLSQVSF
jgi:hypothetical protein